MYPEAYDPRFGVAPDALALTVRAHLYLGEAGAVYADMLVMRAAADAAEVWLRRQGEAERAERAAALRRQYGDGPKYGMSRNQRRQLRRRHPELAPAPLPTADAAGLEARITALPDEVRAAAEADLLTDPYGGGDTD